MLQAEKCYCLECGGLLILLDRMEPKYKLLWFTDPAPGSQTHAPLTHLYT